jgi:hypothetical protein
MKSKHLVAIAIILLAALGFIIYGVAYGHTGSPALTVFSNGQTLTASALNANFAHIHNTLSGGISNANIAPNAAIAQSKLAKNPLVPIAVGSAFSSGGIMAPCSGPWPAAGAADTQCTQAKVSGATLWRRTVAGGGKYLVIKLTSTGATEPNDLVVTFGQTSNFTQCHRSVPHEGPINEIILFCTYTPWDAGDPEATDVVAAFNFAVWEI